MIKTKIERVIYGDGRISYRYIRSANTSFWSELPETTYQHVLFQHPELSAVRQFKDKYDAERLSRKVISTSEVL